MKNIILLMLLCVAATYNAAAQMAQNNLSCDLKVTAICYDPNAPCTPCPCPPVLGGPFAIYHYYPPTPPPYMASTSVIVPGNSSVPLPVGMCPPGWRVAYEICIVPNGWCSVSNCAIIENYTTPLTPPSCFTNHGPVPLDASCQECWGMGRDHYCICFDASGNLILGF